MTERDKVIILMELKLLILFKILSYLGFQKKMTVANLSTINVKMVNVEWCIIWKLSFKKPVQLFLRHDEQSEKIYFIHFSKVALF